MTKCPECSAPWKTGTRICDRCGHKLEAVIVGDPVGSTSAPKVTGASELLDRMNDDLATLAHNPPSGGFAAFLTGFFTVPTSGLAFLVVKGLQVFQRSGQTPGRAQLSLRQTIGKANQQYGSDVTVRSTVEKARAQLSSYEDRVKASHRSLFAGLVVGAFLTAIVAGTTIVIGIMIARSEATATAEKVRVVAQQTAEEVAKQKAEAERLAAELARANHEKHVATYTIPTAFAANTPIGQRIAVLVAGERSDPVATQAIVQRLHDQGAANVTGGLFTERFVADGLFNKLVAGDTNELKNLELSRNADKIMLVKKEVQVSQKTGLPVLTGDITITVRLLSADTGAVIESFGLKGVGAGSSREAAEAQAMEDWLGRFPAQKIVTGIVGTKVEVKP